MTKFEVIPAIDILNGQLVRLTQGSYEHVQVFDASPVEMAKTFEKWGAKRIHIVDLNGAKDGRLVNEDLLRDIRRNVQVKIEFGGGVRNIETVEALLKLGVDFVILGSTLVKDPAAADAIIVKHPGKIIAGIDAKKDQVAVQGWIESSTTTLQSLIQRMNTLPIAEVIYTDIERDGTLSGPNIENLKMVAKLSKAPVIASGGVGNMADVSTLRSLASSNVSGCIVGKALLKGKLDVTQLW